jgi:hypothetical protein
LSVSADRRIADPADLYSDRQAMLNWQQWYQLLWKRKLADISKNDG